MRWIWISSSFMYIYVLLTFTVLNYKAPVDLLQGVPGHTTRPEWREMFRISTLVKVPSTTMCLFVYRIRRKWSEIEHSWVVCLLQMFRRCRRHSEGFCKRFVEDSSLSDEELDFFWSTYVAYVRWRRFHVGYYCGESRVWCSILVVPRWILLFML